MTRYLGKLHNFSPLLPQHIAAKWVQNHTQISLLQAIITNSPSQSEKSKTNSCSTSPQCQHTPVSREEADAADFELFMDVLAELSHKDPEVFAKLLNKQDCTDPGSRKKPTWWCIQTHCQTVSVDLHRRHVRFLPILGGIFLAWCWMLPAWVSTLVWCFSPSGVVRTPVRKVIALCDQHDGTWQFRLTIL